jgi:hypothetical protein
MAVIDGRKKTSHILAGLMLAKSLIGLRCDLGEELTT